MWITNSLIASSGKEKGKRETLEKPKNAEKFRENLDPEKAGTEYTYNFNTLYAFICNLWILLWNSKRTWLGTIYTYLYVVRKRTDNLMLHHPQTKVPHYSEDAAALSCETCHVKILIYSTSQSFFLYFHSN